MQDWRVIERAKIPNFTGFISSERLKQGAAGDLFY